MKMRDKENDIKKKKMRYSKREREKRKNRKG